jgi:hypothetical protein
MATEAPVQQGVRRHERITLPKGMFVAWYGGGKQEVSRAQTLSVGGVSVGAMDPAPVGTKLRLVFEVPGGSVRADGIVRHIEPGQGMGIEFTKLGPQDRILLDRLLKRLLQ